MNFKAVIDSDILRNIIKSVSHIVTDARINLSPDGMKIRAVDPANVAMVFVDAPQTAFSFFESETGEIALDLNKLDQFADSKEPISPPGRAALHGK